MPDQPLTISCVSDDLTITLDGGPTYSAHELILALEEVDLLKAELSRLSADYKDLDDRSQALKAEIARLKAQLKPLVVQTQPDPTWPPEPPPSTVPE